MFSVYQEGEGNTLTFQTDEESDLQAINMYGLLLLSDFGKVYNKPSKASK